MDHVKKMILIDPKMYRPSMRDKSLSALDTEIDSILNSEIPHDEKAKRYNAILNKFRAHTNPTQAKTPVIDQLEPEILKAVPPNQAYKAKRLLDHLKKQADVDWSTSGELIYRQRNIPDSNIIDLINDVLKTKSTEAPNGWEAFAKSLENAPQELIGNTERRRFIREPTTPKRKRTKKHNWIEY